MHQQLRTKNYLLNIIEITDKDQWNSELAKLPYAHVLQTWEWGEFKYETTDGNRIVAHLSGMIKLSRCVVQVNAKRVHSP